MAINIILHNFKTFYIPVPYFSPLYIFFCNTMQYFNIEAHYILTTKTYFKLFRCNLLISRAYFTVVIHLLFMKIIFSYLQTTTFDLLLLPEVGTTQLIGIMAQNITHNFRTVSPTLYLKLTTFFNTFPPTLYTQFETSQSI